MRADLAAAPTKFILEDYSFGRGLELGFEPTKRLRGITGTHASVAKPQQSVATRNAANISLDKRITALENIPCLARGINSPEIGIEGINMLSKKIAALAALSVMTASSAAVAQSAQPLSLGHATTAERSGADLQGSNELRGTTMWIIGAIALGLIIWGAIELLDDDDSESP